MLANPFASAAPQLAGPAAGAQAASAGGGGAQAVVRLRPLLEPLLQRRGGSWEAAAAALRQGDELARLDAALCGGDAQASTAALEQLLERACPEPSGGAEKKQAEEAVAPAYRAVVVGGDEQGGALRRQGSQSKRRLATEAAGRPEPKTMRLGAAAAQLSLSTQSTGLPSVSRGQLEQAARDTAAAADNPAVMGVPLDTADSRGAASSSAAAAVAVAAPKAAAAAPVPPAERPMTATMQKELDRLVETLLDKGLPNSKAPSGGARGIFDLDLVAMNVPGYTQLVPEPMDLATMKDRLQASGGVSACQYGCAADFAEDFKRLVTACRQYNGGRSREHPGYEDGQYYLGLVVILQKQFEKLWAALMAKMAKQQWQEENQQQSDESEEVPPFTHTTPRPQLGWLGPWPSAVGLNVPGPACRRRNEARRSEVRFNLILI